ncbi:hypothetical protein SCE1572_43495 [Sorangium cellulosum So0157-2]|uniref:Uncharacterized protein n=1 Tax=Sorangium cellulosum So0157-2 TaxID=1254432 RepID=S4YD66_SORCE|nr:hypothetical protein SCE1572_43495 [Sorangium cellulosum So0157-2]
MDGGADADAQHAGVPGGGGRVAPCAPGDPAASPITAAGARTTRATVARSGSGSAKVTAPSTQAHCMISRSDAQGARPLRGMRASTGGAPAGRSKTRSPGATATTEVSPAPPCTAAGVPSMSTDDSGTTSLAALRRSTRAWASGGASTSSRARGVSRSVQRSPDSAFTSQSASAAALCDAPAPPGGGASRGGAIELHAITPSGMSSASHGASRAQVVRASGAALSMSPWPSA